jgi:hypothetical protein
MSAFGFDPEQIFARRRSRPRIVRPPGQLRRRIIIFSVLAAIVVLLVAARWLLGLRAEYLYYVSLGHTNVFWTPLIAHIVLFFIGFAIVAVLFAGAVIGCAAAAANLDRRGRRIVLWSGLVIGILAGIAGGSTLSGEWQDILVWLHSVPFGSTDPVFHLDYSFFVFTLPAIDDFMGLLWGGVILGLLAAIAMAVAAITVMNAPEELPLPLDPPPGRTPESALRAAGSRWPASSSSPPLAPTSASITSRRASTAPARTAPAPRTSASMRRSARWSSPSSDSSRSSPWSWRS